jgi:hypothetical protein
MSLLLKLRHIGDWKIGSDYFRRGTFSHLHSHSTTYVKAENPDWCFTSHTASGGGLVLDMGARVWLDVWVWDGLQFSRGGYLEEVTHRYDFNNLPNGYGGTENWHVDVKTLGVRPDAYSGGVKIEGIASPPPAWTDITSRFNIDRGSIYISESQSFVWYNNTRVSIINWRAAGVGFTGLLGSMSAVVCGAVANNIQWAIEGHTP